MVRNSNIGACCNDQFWGRGLSVSVRPAKSINENASKFKKHHHLLQNKKMQLTMIMKQPQSLQNEPVQQADVEFLRFIVSNCVGAEQRQLRRNAQYPHIELGFFVFLSTPHNS